MNVSSRLLLAVLMATAVTSWCSTSDNTEYIHFGCYYEVHKCATPPYYIENHRPNTSIFEICFNFTSTREWKSFGIQTLQQTECISGPHFHQPLNPTCFKSGNCSADRGNLTLYSYDVYVMKGNVSVFAWPSFIKKPNSTVALQGSQVTFLCNATGSPMPTLLWYKDGLELPGLTSRYQILNDNSTLTIKKADRTDEGRYSCNVSNSIGPGLSSSANLTVNYLPKILVSPNDATTVEKANVTLTCYLEGKPRTTVSWFKDGTPIPTNDARIYLSPPTSVSNTSTTITITIVNRTDEGNYSCRAVNDVGNDTSSAAFLTVNFKPEIQHKPTDATVIQGEQASFYCNATGVPKPVISWRYSGSSTPKHIGNKLLIDNVRNTEEYEGKYTCIASSRAGKTEQSATLTVLVPPTMKTALTQGKILHLGQTLRLKCDIYGDPEPSFSWTKRLSRKEEKILLPNQKKYHLDIPDVRVKNAAFYGCTAKNKIGSITLDEVIVGVNTSLDIINSGQTFNAIEGRSTTIKCLASSEILPKEVTLFKDGTKLKTETYISQDEQVMTATLDLTKVTTNESGTYTCVARNRQKKTRANVTLTVYVPFKVDMDVSLKNKTFTRELYDNSTEEYRNLTAEFIGEITKVYENEAGFIRVEVLGFSNGSVSVQFRVVYRIKVENPEEKPPSDTKVRIANVLVRRVKRTNGIVGNLVLKAESLKPRVIPPAPRNLTAINIKKTSLTIHWRPPLYYDHYSVEKYIIKCKEFAGSWENPEAPGKHLDTFYLDDLEPDTSYSIQACAVNHVGEGIPSETIEIKTLSDFWSKFTKILVPIFIMLLMIGVIVLLYIRRQRTRREIKLITEIEGKRSYHEFHEGGKKLEFVDAMEMVELPVRCRLIPHENLELGQVLGSGQFGVVHKGFLKETGEDEDGPCAVKMLKPGASESDYRDLFSELEIMCSVDEHPNIINLLGACRGGGAPLYVVVEFAENGCLLDYLRENRTTTLDEDGNEDEVSSLQNKEKIRIALDIAKGMAHLANHKCVHRDLAARNVLLGKDRIAKVADFGLARDVYEQGFYEKSSSGGKLPAKWMSIEALETLRATSESDVWSFGVLMWEIETAGKMPFAGLDYMELLKALKSGVRLQKPRNCSEELYSIMKDCWEANPEKRPKFKVLSLVLDNHLMAFVDNKC